MHGHHAAFLHLSNHPDRKESPLKKEAPTTLKIQRTKKRVLSRVLAEELEQIAGGSHFNTFTRCPIDVCDFDLD